MSEPTDWRKGLRDASPLLSLGWNIALALALFAGGGIWLDRQLGFSPWLTLLGSALAFAAMGALLLRAVRFSNTETKRKGQGKRYTRIDDWDSAP